MQTTAQFANSVDLLHKEAFNSGLKNSPYTKHELILGTVTPERLNEVFTIYNGIGSAFTPVAEGANFQFEVKKEIGRQTVSPLHYKRATEITSFMLNSPVMGVQKAEELVVKNAHGFGNAFKNNRDRKAAQLYNNADSSTTVWDGLSLANTAHLIGDTGSTQSNITTTTHATAFTYDDIINAQEDLRNQVDHDGEVMELDFKYVIVPSRAQSRTLVNRYLGSTRTPEDANNSINTLFDNNYVVVEWARLTNTNIRAILLTEEAKDRIMMVDYLPFMAHGAMTDPMSGNAIFGYEQSFNTIAVDYLGVQFIMAS